MHPRQDLPASLAALAGQRAGVVASREVLDAGISPNSLVRLGRSWTRLASGLWCLESPTWESMAWAGVLRGGGTAVIGGEAAAYLHGLVRTPPATLTCWAARHPEPFGWGAWQVRYRRGERRGVGTLPRTSLDETLFDLASESDENTTVAAVTRAFAQSRTTPERIARRLSSMPRVGKRRLLDELCSVASKGIESALEWQFDKLVLRAHALPRPTRQVKIGRARVDLGYEEFRLVIELDGQRDHLDWSRDMMRDNAHAVRAGTTTLRYGWDATCNQACAAASQVAEALTIRGWRGRLTPCPGCR